MPGEASPVLIVGAGPAGLFAACELARHGFAARVVERRDAPHRETRATVIQAATLEVLSRAGLAEQFLAAGVRVRGTRFVGPGMTEFAAMSFAGIGCPYEYQCSLPQWRTQEILAEHLRSLGGHIEYGMEAVSMDDAGEGSHVTVRQSDGTTTSAWYRFVLGAGGARSITRHTMHLTLDGGTYTGHYIAADVRCRVAAAREQGMLMVGPTGFVTLTPLPDQRWLLFVNCDEGDTASEPPSSDELGALVNWRIGTDAGLHDVVWSARFLMQHRITPRFADDRHFLLGDAAHLSSPIGGEGINASLMDAADIAWKLALVLGGRAHPSLLDSYAFERGLADQQALEVSDAAHNRIMAMVAVCADGGLPLPPSTGSAQAIAAARARAMLDVSYVGSPLIGVGGGDRFADRVRLRGMTHHLLMFGAPCPPALRRRWNGLVEVVDAKIAGFDAARAGVPEGGAVLVRPDGFVAFRLAAAEDAGMAAIDAHLARYLIPVG